MDESFCMIDTVFLCNTVNPPLFSAVKNRIWWACTKDDKDGCNQNNNDEKKVIFEQNLTQKIGLPPLIYAMEATITFLGRSDTTMIHTSKMSKATHLYET